MARYLALTAGQFLWSLFLPFPKSQISAAMSQSHITHRSICCLRWDGIPPSSLSPSTLLCFSWNGVTIIPQQALDQSCLASVSRYHCIFPSHFPVSLWTSSHYSHKKEKCSLTPGGKTPRQPFRRTTETCISDTPAPPTPQEVTHIVSHFSIVVRW